MKQLQLFDEARSAPKRKLTRKRIERIERAYDNVRTHRHPKLPTAPLWRRLTKLGMFVLAGLIEKPIPRAKPKRPSERTLRGRSVLGQVDPLIDVYVEDITEIMVENFDEDNRPKRFTQRRTQDRRQWIYPYLEPYWPVKRGKERRKKDRRRG